MLKYDSLKSVLEIWAYSQDMQTNITTFYIFLPNIRVSGKNINFDDKKINKSNFYKNKILFKIDDTDVHKILVSKKEHYGKNYGKSFKYFIGYNDNDHIGPLCVNLPQMIGYVKHFDINKKMSF